MPVPQPTIKKVVSMKHVVLALLFAGLLLAATAPAAPKLVRAEGTAAAMGSAFSVIAWGEDQGRLQAAVADALDEARRLDEMLSNYRPASELSQVNRQAAKQPVHVSTELYRLLAACQEYSRASEGTFDITVGPLMKVWGFYKERAISRIAPRSWAPWLRSDTGMWSSIRALRRSGLRAAGWNSIRAVLARDTRWIAWRMYCGRMASQRRSSPRDPAVFMRLARRPVNRAGEWISKIPETR